MTPKKIEAVGDIMIISFFVTLYGGITIIGIVSAIIEFFDGGWLVFMLIGSPIIAAVVSVVNGLGGKERQ